MSDVTAVLEEINAGNAAAAERLIPMIYQELREVARRQLSKERAGHTLQTTALVHEAYIRLLGPDLPAKWSGRAHFFAAASEAMRRILIESARRQAG